MFVQHNIALEIRVWPLQCTTKKRQQNNHARSRALCRSTLYEAVAAGVGVRATPPIENEVGQ